MLTVELISNLRDTALIKYNDVIKRINVKYLSFVNGVYMVNSKIWNKSPRVKKQ